MAKSIYCWRCKNQKPMLDEHEWEIVRSLLTHSKELIQQLKEPKESYGVKALEKYFSITGYRETNPDVLWHHRSNMFGPICKACGKPYRTPKASHCAECGNYRAYG